MVRIRTASDPFIQPGLFRNKNFSVGLFIAFIATALSFSITFMTPQYLTALNHLSPGSIGLVLFPAAIASALMGRKGGKLADERGNFFVVSTASLLMLRCFTLLSTFVGVSPFAIAVMIILGNVGQTFMQISLSNTISRTLTKEQTGVGMGLFSMLNFISGAIAMSLIGKTLDSGSTSIHLNPLVKNASAYVYSNIFLVLSILTLAVWVLYRLQFRPAVAAIAAKTVGQAK